MVTAEQAAKISLEAMEKGINEITRAKRHQIDQDIMNAAKEGKSQIECKSGPKENISYLHKYFESRGFIIEKEKGESKNYLIKWNHLTKKKNG